MNDVYQKLRDSARGQECTLLLPSICQGGTDTTVLCHLPSHIGLKGAGMKVPDWWAIYGCRACHDTLDKRYSVSAFHAFCTDKDVLLAVQRTLKVWFDLGLLRVAGDEEKPRRKSTSSKIMPRPEKFRR